MNAVEKMTVSDIVRNVFDGMDVGTEFSGLEFKQMCIRLEPKYQFKYEDTFMRLLRLNRRVHFVCINRGKSLYRKVSTF